MDEAKQQRLQELQGVVSDSLDADMYVYTGAIERPGADLVIRVIDGRKDRRTNCVLILTTDGGDADAAYLIARQLKRSYERFSLFVFGYCKSAGTLVALGADEIVMSAFGELGPLDVQTIKEDVLGRRNSGLDIFTAIAYLSEESFKTFEKAFIQVIARSGGAITTKTAAEIASSLANGLLAPISAQIDPLRLGEMQRAMNIAEKYGTLLGADPSIVQKLISDYPSHTFVIDEDEAATLFPCVRTPSEAEQELVALLQEHLTAEAGVECIRTPHPEAINFYVITREARDVENGADEHAERPEPDEHDGTAAGPIAQASGDHSTGQGPDGTHSAVSENGSKQDAREVATLKA